MPGFYYKNLLQEFKLLFLLSSRMFLEEKNTISTGLLHRIVLKQLDYIVLKLTSLELPESSSLGLYQSFSVNPLWLEDVKGHPCPQLNGTGVSDTYGLWLFFLTHWEVGLEHRGRDIQSHRT